MKSFLASLLLTSAAIAADGEYTAVTRSDAALRAAPSAGAEQIGTVPANTALAANVCFDEGAYCFVTGEGIEGYVAGDLLTISGDTYTVLSAEKARWALMRKNRVQSAATDFEAQNIVVWGDSLSHDTFGAELANLLPGRDVSMQGVPGETGASIASRMLADTRYTSRLKIIWDRHATNETPTQYLSDLKPIIDRAAETGDFLILSDIRQITADGKVDLDSDKRTTDEINRELARLYPAHFVDVSAALDPASMRVADGLHLSKPGYDAVASALATAINARATVAAK